MTEPAPQKSGSRYEVPASPYDEFMDAEGVPVHRVLGAKDVREVELGDWKRLNARGAFIQPHGTEGLWGMFAIGVPERSSTTPERHLYEEVFYVVEGTGTAEVWTDGTQAQKRMFEWQAGSIFTVPLNSWHRLVNASGSQALLLASTTAPPVINLFGFGSFTFDNPANFDSEFEERADYFRYRDEVTVEPVRKQPLLRSNLIPDLVRCNLPNDPSGRRRHHVELSLGSGKQFIWVGETELGRYAKAHYHAAGPILFCLRGQGYTYTWPRAAGTKPWENGNEEAVQRQDYGPGGFVAAAPAGGDWFHQHFGVGTEPLRLLRLGGSVNGFNQGAAGTQVINPNVSIEAGGHSIDYEDEDPHIPEEFARMMEKTAGSSG